MANASGVSRQSSELADSLFSRTRTHVQVQHKKAKLSPLTTGEQQGESRARAEEIQRSGDPSSGFSAEERRAT